jgi:hypothetical protein
MTPPGCGDWNAPASRRAGPPRIARGLDRPAQLFLDVFEKNVAMAGSIGTRQSAHWGAPLSRSLMVMVTDRSF